MAVDRDTQVVPFRPSSSRLVPDYEQVFKAPPRKFRPEGKKYGRLFTKAHWGDQWMKYNANLAKANSWLHDALHQNDTKRDDETKRDWLRRICDAKIKEENEAFEAHQVDYKVHMEPLQFEGTIQIWQRDDIVEHLVEHLAQQRKRRNRKQREQAHVNEIMPDIESTGGTEAVAVESVQGMESNDENFVMAEIGENDRYKLPARLFSEIKQLKKYVPNSRRFDGYTKESDVGRLRMLADYFRERKMSAV